MSLDTADPVHVSVGICLPQDLWSHSEKCSCHPHLNPASHWEPSQV